MHEIRLEQQIQRAQQNPESEESKLAVSVGNIVEWLRNGSADWAPAESEILEQLDSLADIHQIAHALAALGQWELHREYENGAAEALPLLRDVADDTLNDDWYNVALVFYTLAAELGRQLDEDQILSTVTTSLYSEFREHWPDLSRNTRGTILDTTGYVLSGIESEQQVDIVDMLSDIATEAHEESALSFERRVLDTMVALDESGGATEEELQERLVFSFEKQLDVQDRSGAHEASVLQEALSRCHEFLDFAQQNEWKAALRRAHRDSIDELTEFTHEPTDGELDELDEAVEDILDDAEQIANEEHRVNAVYYLLAVPIFIPRATLDVDGREGASLTEILPRLILTGEGDAVPEYEESQRHAQYGLTTQFRDKILTATLRRALERRIISESSLFLYLWSIEALSVDDVAYITDMIIAHFDGRYGDSMHVGVARLEGAIASMLQYEGVETASLREEYMTPTPLPGLLNRLEELGVDQDLVEYLRYKYADISGQQIRNKIAHGRAGYGWAAWNLSLVLLYDILLTVGWLEDNLRYYAE